MNNQRGAIPFITGAFVGSLAGAAVAILYAPQSGDETRKKIRDTASQTADSARLAVVNAQEQALSAISEAQSKASRFISQIGDGHSREDQNSPRLASHEPAGAVAPAKGASRQVK